jgi:DNA (cytosine-5)-methyltransferase 1
MSFKFIDLFAGIGGFHAALEALGGECVYASEWDKNAASIYERNWGFKPDGDITLSANDETMKVPPHDVLVGGFPCQPFSKSGKQKGMDETRGTLFWNIAKIIEVRRPSIVLLENVRNIAGPRHIHEWNVIINTLRDLGYCVSSEPLVVSPHQLNPDYGGRPQIRERVFISATKIPMNSKNIFDEVGVPDLSRVKSDWSPGNWNLKKHLPLESKLTRDFAHKVELTDTELEWIDAWNEFVFIMRRKLKDSPLPGFPLWVDDWVDVKDLVIPEGTPEWKQIFLRKNSYFYTMHKKELNDWLKNWGGLQHFPASRRKFEWQAQDAGTLWDTIMHFRPSGIRAKKATYVPALVAITQTSIIGPQKRRLTVREAARLQGLPDWFQFNDQPASASYKQLGNGVNVGVVYNVIKAQVERDKSLLVRKSALVKSVLNSPNNPDKILMKIESKK